MQIIQGSNMTIRILYVEDDEAVGFASQQTMQLHGFEVELVTTAEQALPLLQQDPHWVLLTDVRLPGISGLELLKQALALDSELPVILVTGHGDIDMAVSAMRSGAYDFIAKPYASERLIDILKRALQTRHLILENRSLRAKLQHQQGDQSLIGSSPAMQSLRKTLASLADTNVDILIHGETGVGKEQVARALHNWSYRRDKHLVALNCAALPESVFESEIFGYEAGAFTGASKKRIGKIEYANGGTLFLDEIEGMPMLLQTKLLRVLQERVVERLGSNTLTPVDCRVVAATKEDLLQMSQENRFRADLYFRLNVVPVNIPPLRERLDDIDELFPWFVSIAAERFQRPLPEISSKLLGQLKSYAWPGNVRELRNFAERHVLGIALDNLATATHATPATNHLDQAPNDSGLAQQVDHYERQLLEQALRASQGQVTQAAEQLKLARKTMYDKLTKHDLDPREFR